MPEQDPTGLPERSRQRLPIVPMKPYEEAQEPEKRRIAATLDELRFVRNALRQIWRDISERDGS